MFKRILVAVDGSPYSEYAVPDTIAVASCFKSEVFVLHVLEHEQGRAAAFPLETTDQAARLVAGAVKAIQEAGIVATGEVQRAITGHTPKHIVEAAMQKDCDLIVMGSRGLSDIGGLLLGSVTHKVLQLTHVAVLVARGPKSATFDKELVGAGRATSA